MSLSRWWWPNLVTDIALAIVFESSGTKLVKKEAETSGQFADVDLDDLLFV